MAQQKLGTDQIKLTVQKKTISYTGTYDAAGNIFYKDLGSAGNWDTPFTNLISVYYTTDSTQLWASGNGASATSAGNVRAWRWTSTSISVTITVTGIGTIE